MAERVRFQQGDVCDLLPSAGAEFDHVFCNPPFHTGEGEASPDPMRERALRDTGDLTRWIETGVKQTRTGGAFTIVLTRRDGASALAKEG